MQIAIGSVFQVVGPRFFPDGRAAQYGNAESAENEPIVDGISAVNSPLNQNINPLHNPVSISVNLNFGFELTHITSLYHPIVQASDGHKRYRVRLEAGPMSADRDFVLEFSPKLKGGPGSAYLSEKLGDYEYGYLLLVPPADRESHWSRQRTARELSFVIDTSGSMAERLLHRPRPR